MIRDQETQSLLEDSLRRFITEELVPIEEEALRQLDILIMG